MRPIATQSFDTDLHLSPLLTDIKAGLLIPVVGGDVNLCGRPLRDGIPVGWHEDDTELSFPPTTSELVLCLLRKVVNEGSSASNLPGVVRDLFEEQLERSQDSISAIGLANVCQYIQFVDREILEWFLPHLLKREYCATPVHDFLVRLAQYRPDPKRADTPPYPCIVTTCFDQVLEQQLRKNNVDFHLVAFVLVENGGVFQYTAPGEDPEYAREIGVDGTIPDLKEHPVVLKLNGGIRPGKRDFAITEDHLIDYLSHQGIKDALPEMLLAKLTKRGRKENSHLLFMGYSPCHWSLRVILRRIWSESLSNQNKRWTVVLEEKASSEIDRRFWEEYGLKPRELHPVTSLQPYIETLSRRLAELQPSPGSVTASLPAAPRDGLVFSYSHKDSVWLNMLKRHLNQDQIRMWDDQRIQPGALWRTEIQTALASAKAAVLLVSPDFLNSDFIRTNELPPLLKAATEGGCRILWINIKDSPVDATEISEYQALHKNPALSTLNDADLDEYLPRLATRIRELGNQKLSSAAEVAPV